MKGGLATYSDVYARVVSQEYPQLSSLVSLHQFSDILNCSPCSEFGVFVEDCSKWLFKDENLRKSLAYIDEYMSNPIKCGEEEASFLRTFVNDLLVFGCLTITKLGPTKPSHLHPGQYKFEGEIGRFCVQVLSPELMCTCLSELCFCLARRTTVRGINLNGASLLNHIRVKDYTPEVPILHRMLTVSLSNFALHLREKIIADPLFKRLRDSPNLVLWMLSCSGSDEQYFLNTCDTASSCISLISHHSTISSLLVLSRAVVQEIHSQLQHLSETDGAYPSFWPSSVPSIREYVLSRCNLVTSLLDTIYSSVSMLIDLLDNPTPPSTHAKNQTTTPLSSPTSSPGLTSSSAYPFPRVATPKLSRQGKLQMVFAEAFQLTRDWNYAMQNLSSIFSPSQPIVLTRKPFSERWHLSAFVMRLLCYMTKFVPGQPSPSARTRSSHEIAYIRPHLYHTFRTQVTAHEEASVFYDFAFKVRKLSEPAQQNRLIKTLWRKTVRRGGILYSSREYVFGVGWVGHLNVLFGCTMPLKSATKYGIEKIGIVEEIKDGASGAATTMRVFLIGDPEICNFKVVNFEQMCGILCNETYNFDLLDVGGRAVSMRL